MKWIRVTSYATGGEVLLNLDKIVTIGTMQVPSSIDQSVPIEKTALSLEGGQLLVVDETVDELVEVINGI